MVVSNDKTTATNLCRCRCLPSGQSIYEFRFYPRPLVSDFILSIIFTSDNVNLVLCGVKSSKLTTSDKTAAAATDDDDVLFIVRQINTGKIVSKVQPNHPEYRSHAACF